MKLLIVYETVYPDFIGGVELRNYELAVALCRRGHEVTLAGFCSGLTSTVGNLRIVSLGDLGELGGLYNRAGRRSTRQALRFAAVVRRLDLTPYDVVESPSVPYIHLLPLAWKCAAAGKPLLITWYEYWGGYWRGYVGRLRAPIYRAVEWLSSRLGTAVTATSELTRGRLAAARFGKRGTAGSVGAGLVDLVPCGITVARVRAAAGDRPGDGPPLIYAGRLLEHKRLGLLLRAVQILARGDRGLGWFRPVGDPRSMERRYDVALGDYSKHPSDRPASPRFSSSQLGCRDWRQAEPRPPSGGKGTPPPSPLSGEFRSGGTSGERGEDVPGAAGPLLTVFGEGPDRRRLEALAAELGIAGRVAFRGHVKSSEEVWRELGRARIAVQPSAREGFGLFPLEAMAAGLPVVYCGSPESAVGELVRDGSEGVAAPAEPHALAAALTALLAPAGEAERRRLGRNAEARAALYDWDEIAGSIEAICSGLMARRGRRRR